jgi:hypothetical protein
MTGLTRRPLQSSLQPAVIAPILSVYNLSVFALAERKNGKKKIIKVPLCRRLKNADCVSPVNEKISIIDIGFVKTEFYAKQA